MSVTYGVLNEEPTFYKKAITINPIKQVSECSSLSIRIKEGFNKNTLDFLNAIVLDEKVYVSMNISNDKLMNLISFLLKNGEKEIVLKDIPYGATNYNQYEINVINILNQLNQIPFTNISLMVDIYLNNVIKNINNYSNKLKSIYVNIYGVCIDFTKSINSLLNYSFNLAILTNQTNLLNASNVNLTVQPNTICNLTKGISNTFGSVLWLLDLMFQLSMGKVDEITLDGNDFNVVYAHMLYNFVSENANIFSINILPKSSLNISAYYTRNTNYHNFIIIHKDINEDNIKVTINVNSRNKGKLYRLVSNQTITGEYGITFGELTFDGSKDGFPVSAVTKNSSKIYIGNTKENYTFIVDKLSAVVFQIPIGQTGGSYFENINENDKNRTIVSIQPKTEIGDVDAVETTMTLKEFENNFQPNL
jgi:hypothetical protein